MQAVSVWDSRLASGCDLPNARIVAADFPQVDLLTELPAGMAIARFDRVLKSPGLSPNDDRIAGLLAAARAGGKAVQGELDLFIEALADLQEQRGYSPRLLAITGTNGKTTTTAMAALLIASTGSQVAAAGNIGPTMLQTLIDRLDAIEIFEAAGGAQDGPGAALLAGLADDGQTAVKPSLPDVWVIELSSFQLDGVAHFAPDAAAVLNISEDHLDWHGNMAAYVAAKAGVYGPAGAATVMIVNRDDPQVEAMVPAPLVGKARAAKTLQRRVIRFGLDAPRQPGDYGLVNDNGMVWLARAQQADASLQRGRRGPAVDEELFIQRMMPADALRVRGRHNAANALAALALAEAIDCPLAPMLHALRDYGGEPHRLQFVANVGGVDAFDDSKGTNVGATVAAINGLGSDRTPARLVMILGGDGKGQDFSPLLAPIRRFVRAVATLGRDAEAIETSLLPLTAANDASGQSGLPLQRHPSLDAATRWSFEQALPGDAVLLSPACASLDMFRNYGHRGESFVSSVQALAADQGEVLT